ncbi:hypothetical protein DVH24_028400 [Malus domestica]|uniref:Uncharacterized protein n=1 Tax=Malus domestica TaxID=3750 RepID=A0A498HGR9_MALDO|nr:hypothetical protein DVH24_028400 [Malus domestica]
MPSFDTSHFFGSILLKLKNSLSATLQHCVPQTPSHQRVPPSCSPTGSVKNLVLALQIPTFPKGGFSIRLAMHHAVLEGLPAISFFKFGVTYANMEEEKEEDRHL